MDGRQISTRGADLFRCPAAKHETGRPRFCLPRSAARPLTFVPAVLALLIPYGYGGAREFERVEDSIGPALICNTPQELNRFVDLVNAGRGAVDALRLVNEEAKNPTACGNALASFEVGKSVAEIRMLGELISIVEVKVTALSDGSAWTQVPPTTQYTIREIHGQSL